MKFLFIFILYAIAYTAVLARAGIRTQKIKPETNSRKSLNRLLIVGATGGTGLQLVTQALERGFVVTALVRNPSKLKIEHPNLKIIQGNILDYDVVKTAVEGQDVVISALGHKRFFYPTRILSEGTRNIIRAMKTHDVSRLVCETSLGIGNSAGKMGLYYTLFVIPIILPLYFWDKTRQERVIESSNVEWVIVRPGVLTNKEKRGSYRHGSEIGSFILTVNISRADVADFMLNQVTDDTYLNSAVGVCW